MLSLPKYQAWRCMWPEPTMYHIQHVMLAHLWTWLTLGPFTVFFFKLWGMLFILKIIARKFPFIYSWKVGNMDIKESTTQTILHFAPQNRHSHLQNIDFKTLSSFVILFIVLSPFCCSLYKLGLCSFWTGVIPDSVHVITRLISAKPLLLCEMVLLNPHSLLISSPPLPPSPTPIKVFKLMQR